MSNLFGDKMWKSRFTFLHESFNSEFRRQHRDNTCYWINSTSFLPAWLAQFGERKVVHWKQDAAQATHEQCPDWTRAKSCFTSAQQDHDFSKRSVSQNKPLLMCLLRLVYRNISLKWSSVSILPLKSKSKKKKKILFLLKKKKNVVVKLF